MDCPTKIHVFSPTRESLSRIAVLLLRGKNQKEIHEYLSKRNPSLSPHHVKHIFYKYFKNAKTKEDFRQIINNFITHGERVTGSGHPRWQKPLLKESKEKISRKKKGKMTGKENPFFGQHHTDKTKEKIRESLGDMAGENNPFFGKHHTDKTREKLARLRNGTWDGEGNPNFGGSRRTTEVRYVPDLGHKVRSGWEEKICRILKEFGVKYEYEKEINLGTKIFVVDLYLPETGRFIEIKGYVDEIHIEKMKLFKQLYPNEKLIIVTRRKTILEGKIPKECYDEIYDIVTVSVPELCGINTKITGILKELQESGIELEYDKAFDLGAGLQFVADLHLKNTNRCIQMIGEADEERIGRMKAFRQQHPEAKLVIITRRDIIDARAIPTDCYDEVYDVLKVTSDQLCGKRTAEGIISS